MELITHADPIPAMKKAGFNVEGDKGGLMEEIIEKMARALHKAHGDRYTDIVDWDMLMPWMKDRWLSHARSLLQIQTEKLRLAVVEKSDGGAIDV